MTAHRHHSADKVSASCSSPPAVPSNPVIQRTVSFPWMPSQPPNAPFSPCQSPPAPTQQFWPPMHPYRTPPVQPHFSGPIPTMTATAWSLPTSPYSQSSMQAWSAPLAVPSSAASELSQVPSGPVAAITSTPEAPVESHGSTRRQAEPRRTLARFFSLSSIFNTFRRWHTMRKRRKSRKPTVRVTSATPDDATPMRTSASLPGAFSRASGSDHGIERRNLQIYYDHRTPQGYAQPMMQSFQMATADSSAFMNRMHQSLSNYRT